MSTVKCPTCGALCNATLTNCDICGGQLPVQVQSAGFGQPVNPALVDKPAGFEKPVPTEGFGKPISSGFGAGVPQGFGQPVISEGFGKPVQPGFGQAQRPVGFGQPAQPAAGFGMPAEFKPVGFGQPTPPAGANQDVGAFGTAPKGFNTNQSAGQPVQPVQPGMSADAARFAEAVTPQVKEADSVSWGFGKYLGFLFLQLVPIYGLIITIMCLIGNPRKYPKDLTNYLRAYLVFGFILMAVSIILTLVLGAGFISVLNTYGG